MVSTVRRTLTATFTIRRLATTSDASNGSLFGLIDIAQEKNHQFIRQPTDGGQPGQHSGRHHL